MTTAIDQSILDRFDELMDLRDERKRIEAETDAIRRKTGDAEQLADMTEYDRAMGELTQVIALLCIAHKKGANLTPEHLDGLGRMASAALDALETTASNITTRTPFTSPAGHENNVRPWIARKAVTIEKLQRIAELEPKLSITMEKSK